MIANPFTYGNPISDPSRFVGRQYEIGQVFSRLRNAEFESSSLVGERRIGKTSLLNYLTRPEVRHSYGLDPDQYLFIYVDLQMLEREMTPLRLWKRLLQQMEQCCLDPEIKRILAETSRIPLVDSFVLTDLFGMIDARNQYVVFLLDEFENVTENPHFDLSFFYGLRSLAIHHHLALITSSRRELIELCHSEAIRSSPFFNIFANFNLCIFSEVEAQELISRFLQGSRVSFTSAELDTIFRLAGFHPYFLQAACHVLFEAYAGNINGPEQRLQFLHKKYIEQATPHFEDYWQHSPDQEKIVLTALALPRKQQKNAFTLHELQGLYMRSEQALGHLEKRGLIVSQADTYMLFNASFGDWIRREISNTLHDPQDYKDWLKSNKNALAHFSWRNKKNLNAILSRIGPQYRDLILDWVSDPRTLLMVSEALKMVLNIR